MRSLTFSIIVNIFLPRYAESLGFLFVLTVFIVVGQNRMGYSSFSRTYMFGLRLSYFPFDPFDYIPHGSIGFANLCGYLFLIKSIHKE